jgi:hypothetical protein
MLTAFDRQISINRWINCTKLQSLIIPYGVSIPIVKMVYDREKTFGPFGSVVSKRPNLPCHSASRGICVPYMFQDYFRYRKIVGDTMKGLSECKRLLKEFRTWVCSIISSGMKKLPCFLFLISAKFIKNLCRIEF